MKTLAVLTLLFPLACGHPGEAPPDEAEELLPAAQVAFYRERALQGLDGFVSAEDCDSVLFSGLAGAAGLEVDLLAARRPDGRWERRPLSLGSCLEEGLSDSSTSRDMILGVLWWAWRNQRLDVLQALQAQLLRDNGVLGEWATWEGAARVLVSPTLAGTLAQLIYALGGEDNPLRLLPIPSAPAQRGYQRHLHALHLALRAEAGQPLSAAQRGTLERYTQDDPKNPLFWAVLGERAEAEKRLTEGWPADRLPTSGDWCQPWKIQRADDDPGLAPCPEQGKVHSGADLLFVVSLLEQGRGATPARLQGE